MSLTDVYFFEQFTGAFTGGRAHAPARIVVPVRVNFARRSPAFAPPPPGALSRAGFVNQVGGGARFDEGTVAADTVLEMEQARLPNGDRGVEWQGQYYSAQMCDSEADIDALYHLSTDDGFGNNGGGFNFYRSQIAAAEIWPMAVLLDIEVPYTLRRQGCGTAALEEFHAAARSRGARLAFLRVGWSGDLSNRDRTVSWYQRRGWRPLRIPPVPGLVVPFMYREL